MKLLILTFSMLPFNVFYSGFQELSPGFLSSHRGPLVCVCVIAKIVSEVDDE